MRRRIQEDKINEATPKEVYHAFRLIVTQVVYDREAQFGEETISQIARWGKSRKQRYQSIPRKAF
jgi:hypothetical protein